MIENALPWLATFVFPVLVAVAGGMYTGTVVTLRAFDLFVPL